MKPLSRSPFCFSDAKRIIGRRIEDESIKKWYNPSEPQFSLDETEEGLAVFTVEIGGQKVLKLPEEISAEVLKYLKDCATEFLGEPVTEAVISVPAYFSNAQRKATRKAAELAGLIVPKLITEPVAGALHYVTDKELNAIVLVFDFGGGTLDVSLIEVNNNKFEVKAVAGDTTLGGRNIDKELFKHFYKPLKNVENSRNVLRKIRRLEEECISLKENLSGTNTFSKVLDSYDGNEDLVLALDREKFEVINCDIFQRAMDITKFLLRDADYQITDIEKVILVGGTTRIPKVREMLEAVFGPGKVSTDLNPDEAVAAGAAITAATMKATSAPMEKFKVSEVTPLSLGVEISGALMGFTIRRNTKLPATGTLDVCTARDNQECAQFKIFEGERKITRYNNELGIFYISDLPLKPAGEVTFKVIFNLDEDGILTVSATENSTGNSNKLVVTMGEFRLSEKQINYQIEAADQENCQDDLLDLFFRLIS